MNHTIPRIIHRIRIRASGAPVEDVDREQVRRVNPDWESRLWVRDDIPDDLVCREQLDFLLHHSRKKYPKWQIKYRRAGMVNILKFEVLHRHGGLFVDTGAQFLRPLPAEVTANAVFSAPDNAAMWPDLPSYAYLAASRGNELMRLVLDEIRGLSEEELIAQICADFQCALFLDRVRRRHGYDAVTMYPEEWFVSRYAAYEVQRRAPETAYCAILSFKQARFAAALLAFKRVLDECGVRFFLICGTALGVRREGRFIVHDEDIDVGVFVEDYDPAVEARLLADGFTLRVRYGELASGYEVSFFHTETNTLVDIFLHYRHAGDAATRPHIWFASGFRSTDGFCRFVQPPFALAPVEFVGAMFLLPDPIDRYLAVSYGDDWRIPRDFGFYDGLRTGMFKSMVPNADLRAALTPG